MKVILTENGQQGELLQQTLNFQYKVKVKGKIELVDRKAFRLIVTPLRWGWQSSSEAPDKWNWLRKIFGLPLYYEISIDVNTRFKNRYVCKGDVFSTGVSVFWEVIRLYGNGKVRMRTQPIRTNDPDAVRKKIYKSLDMQMVEIW
jgi:hypothetical protein